jgi:type I restriction enzyme S subunit
VRPPKNELSGDWLASTYRHERSQRQILARAVGSTMVNLNAGLLSTLLIAKPKLDEQTVIVERLAAQDKCIRAEEANRDKLIKIKKGLLHDLLTGCVRVPAPKSEVVMV